LRSRLNAARGRIDTLLARIQAEPGEQAASSRTPRDGGEE
jgi:hypothetical protein